MNSAEYNQLKALIEQLNAKVDTLFQLSLTQEQMADPQPARPIIQTPTKIRDSDDDFAFDINPVNTQELMAQEAIAQETIPHGIISQPVAVPKEQPCLEAVMSPQPQAQAPTRIRTRATRAQAAPCSTVGDLFASMAQTPTVAEVLVQKRERKPLNESISTNDRYLFVKVLFNWDESLYSNTIAAMEDMDSMREVEDYLAQHFPDWEVTSPAVHRFLHQMEEYVR